MDRLSDLVRFYELLDGLVQRLGGLRRLADCDGRQDWPERGVYFFFEMGEMRSDSGSGPRVVRVGTHAITGGSRTSLWGRLSQHRGAAKNAGGNHRASIFRFLIGAALQGGIDTPVVSSWGHKRDFGQAARTLGEPVEELRAKERRLEAAVSMYIGAMPFLWIDVPDPPGPGSRRNTIERGTIALLSNWNKPALDPPSSGWLGLSSDRDRIRGSGLWEQSARWRGTGSDAFHDA